MKAPSSSRTCKTAVVFEVEHLPAMIPLSPGEIARRAPFVMCHCMSWPLVWDVSLFGDTYAWTARVRDVPRIGEAFSSRGWVLGPGPWLCQRRRQGGPGAQARILARDVAGGQGAEHLRCDYPLMKQGSITLRRPCPNISFMKTSVSGMPTLCIVGRFICVDDIKKTDLIIVLIGHDPSVEQVVKQKLREVLGSDLQFPGLRV